MSAYEKHLEKIRQSLQPGEEILASARASHVARGADTQIGTIAATTARVAFSGSIALKKETLSFPWSQITAIDEERSALSQHVTIAIPGSGARFRVTWKDANVQEFVTAARERLAAAQAPAASAASSSLADELAKLAVLLDQGVLSPEEFAAAKTRLVAG